MRFPLLTAAMLLLAFAGGPRPGVAASYYVNPHTGNDAWSGTAAAPAGSSVGPWLTLSRVAAAALEPGDTVYLACGGKWAESLTLPASGTPAAPIRIQGGPEYCAVAPTIDGSLAIPSQAWTLHGGSVYRTRLPIQLISNPSLAASVAGWTHWSALSDSTLAYENPCAGATTGCMRFRSGNGSSLIISSSFPVDGGSQYEAGAMLKAPAGTRLRIVVRRAEPPYDPLSSFQTAIGTGAWQSIHLPFRATKTAPRGRLDIEVQAVATTVHLRDAYVRRPVSGVVAGVYADALRLRPAHHPNFGAGGSAASPFAVAANGSGTWLDLGALGLPAGGAITPGLGISAKVVPFLLDERRIAAVSGNRVTLDTPATYAAAAGTPFFLTGALWMLDSPGEWFYDSSSGDLFVWMPDGAAPGNRVSVSALARGIDFGSRENIVIDGLAVRAVGTGAWSSRGKSIRIQNSAFRDILDNGVDAENCANCAIQGTTIERTGLQAVRAIGSLATGFQFTDSTVREIGTVERTDGWRTLPRPGRAAVDIGASAMIIGNTIHATTNAGIYAGARSFIGSNYVGRTCLQFNDCGGIYVHHFGSGSHVEGNLVLDIPGGLAGLPQGAPNQAVGIYLDNGATGVEVARNVVAGAELGLHIHDSDSNWIHHNTFFGNRRFQIWLQEQNTKRRPAGDVHSNRIEQNVLVPSAGGASLVLESEIGDVADFATFHGNHYSALYSPRVVTRKWPSGSDSFLLSEWTAAGLETGARETLPTGAAAFLAVGGNLIPNGLLNSGLAGWTWWNASSPPAQAGAISCGQTPCLRIVAGGSPTLLSTPNFSLVQGQWYRVAFDAATSIAGQAINVTVRRGGGGSAGYEPLAASSETFSGTISPSRYAFAFQATRTVNANDPQTRELGARIDFERIQPGTFVTISNVELVQLAPIQTALKLRMPVNPAGSSTLVDCPAADAAAGLCGLFASLTDGTPIAWPVSVPALGGIPMYTRDLSVADSDGDGVADNQDVCPSTVPGRSVNARGCSLGQ